MGTAKQLIPAFVDAEPLEFGDRSYSKNMRPIRGYPNYWRIIDTESFIDGPPAEGEIYTKNEFLWRVQILRDKDGNLTDTFEAVNLGDYLTGTSSEVNGETVYRYKYNSGIESFQYQHTDVVDSVSIEFDQLGRRTIAFESNGDVYLIWYDSQAGEEVVTNWGAGYNPSIITDTYRRTGGSADSERLLFYVDNTTKQIVYRKQLDRFQVVYTLPSAPSDVVELLKVSKNIYGGITAIYCYDTGGAGIGEGSLSTGSFTAEASLNEEHLGTDNNIVSKTSIASEEFSLVAFDIRVTGFARSANDTSNFSASNTSIPQFFLGEKKVDILEEDNSSMSASSLSVSAFSLEQTVTFINESIDDTASFSSNSASTSNFKLKETLIEVSSETDFATLSASSISFTNFTLG